MSVLDSFITVGKETTYGTLASTLTRGLEALVDPAARQNEYLVSNGMRPGFDATRANRRRAVQMGATGSLEVDLCNRGHGLLLEAAVGVADVEAGTPTEMTFESSPAGPTTSLSVQVSRGTIAGSNIPANYLGGMVTSWELSQRVGGEDALAKLKLTMDYQQEVHTSVTPAVPTFAENVWLYAWPDCTVTVGGSGCVLDLTLSGNNGLKVDRRCLKGTTAKEKPYRNAVPTYGGTFSTDYADDTINDLFRSGATTPIVVTWAGPDGDLVRFSYPAAQFTGDTPQVSPGSSTQSAPWVALSNGIDPAMTVEYLTADTAP